MTRYQQQVVKRMDKLHGQGQGRETPSAAALIGVVLIVGLVAWMYVVVVFSMAIHRGVGPGH